MLPLAGLETAPFFPRCNHEHPTEIGTGKGHGKEDREKIRVHRVGPSETRHGTRAEEAAMMGYWFTVLVFAALSLTRSTISETWTDADLAAEQDEHENESI